MVIKNRQVNILLSLFILVSFLHPRGFDEISSAYKSFFTVCIYLSLFFVVFLFLIRITRFRFILNYKNCWFLVFFALNIVLTLISDDGLHRGLQILFASPALLYFVIYEIRYAYHDFLKCISALLILFLLFNIPFTELFFKNNFHIMFIGHVQVASQVGLMSILIAVLNVRSGRSKIGAVLLVLAIINMIYSQTDSALAVLIICVIAYLLYRLKIKNILTHNSSIYAVIMLCLSILVIFCTVNPYFRYLNLSFNGRNLIWDSALNLLKEKFWFGYGVENAFIEIPWSEPMTYAHNQILQLLLDGGVILTLSFCLMILQCCRGINKSKSKNLRWILNTVLISLMFIMIFDSTTLYCYMYVILGILVSAKRLDGDKIKAEGRQRNFIYKEAGRVYQSN